MTKLQSLEISTSFYNLGNTLRMSIAPGNRRKRNGAKADPLNRSLEMVTKSYGSGLGRGYVVVLRGRLRE